MSLFNDKVRRFLKDESGQSTTEYILILSIVVMLAMKFRGTFKKTMESSLSKLDSNLNDVLSSE